MLSAGDQSPLYYTTCGHAKTNAATDVTPPFLQAKLEAETRLEGAAMILVLMLAAALAMPPEQAPQTPQERMDALQQVYDTSCGNRGYGEYDDVCNSIRDQIKQADRELTRKARTPRKLAEKPAAMLPPAAAPVSAATDTPPTTAPPGGYSAAPASPKR